MALPRLFLPLAGSMTVRSGQGTFNGSCDPKLGKVHSPPSGTRAQFSEPCEQRAPARDRRGGHVQGGGMAPFLPPQRRNVPLSVSKEREAGQRLRARGQGGHAGPKEGTHSRAQRRPMASGSRSCRRWAQGPSHVADALLQRLGTQHCLMILLNAWDPNDHSYFMLVLGHLGAQRLLSSTFTFDSAERRKEEAWVLSTWPELTQNHRMAGPVKCYPTPPPDPVTGHTLQSISSTAAQGHLQVTAKRGPEPAGGSSLKPHMALATLGHLRMWQKF